MFMRTAPLWILRSKIYDSYLNTNNRKTFYEKILIDIKTEKIKNKLLQIYGDPRYDKASTYELRVFMRRDLIEFHPLLYDDERERFIEDCLKIIRPDPEGMQ